MKRALKITLLVFGGIAAAAALLVWDTNARAARAIRAHEERLAADIAALRTRPTLQPVGELLVESGNPLPSLLITGSVRPLAYEKAHSGQEELLRDHARSIDLLRRQGWMEDTAKRLFQKWEVLQESLREGGYLAYEFRRRDEEQALKVWKTHLEKKNPNADELRQVAGLLDRLLSTRPVARDILLAESVLDRLQVLNWLHSHDESYWMLVDTPGWKEAYSRSLLAAKALNQLRVLEQRVLEIEALPIFEREPIAIEEGQKHLRSERLTRSDLAARAGALFQGERLLLTEWALARVATAIGRFQLEKKRNPADLKELVPEFLKEVPINVYTGEPFLWDKDKGVLETRPGGQGLQSRWELRR
jgi:hypothetical protein